MTTVVQLLPIDLSAIGKLHLTFAVIGYSIVFVSLFLLYLVFSLLPMLFTRNLRRKFKKEGGEEKAALADNKVPGEVSAAIATAISLYLEELHDQESAILTIKKVGKSYSPWNSKIYNVINFNRFQR
ncbi:MAG: OadG family protein [Chlorobiales bacterium]|jgi:Na+-transporting methylmalonyl-CoA/oxaloacetate decarboxylase gamma subunit|nr:OadG family protein [Chlorobiales bacterium]